MPDHSDTTTDEKREPAIEVHGRSEDGRLKVTLPSPRWSNPHFLTELRDADAKARGDQ